MGQSNSEILKVMLTYQDGLSAKAPRTIESLLGIGKAARGVVKDIDKLNKALGLNKGGGKPLTPQLPKELQLGLRLTKQTAAEMQRGLRIETQQAKLLREQAKLRQDGVRLAREETHASEAGARAQRASILSETAEVKLARERLKLQRESEHVRARRRGSFFDKVETFNKGVRTARNVRDVAQTTIDTVRGFTDPAMKELRSEERFKMMGFTPAENRKAFTAIDDTVNQVKGVRRSDVIEGFTGLINTFGDIDEAVQFLPITAKYRANMEALYGDLYSPEQVTGQINNAFKAMETLGFDRPTGAPGADGKPTFSPEDRARMSNRFNLVARATAATGGEINPDEFRAFAKYSRLGGLGLTEEGLAKMLPLVGQLGGSTTGQSLMRVYSALVGGVMKKDHIAEWERLGMIDTGGGNVTYDKGGKGKKKEIAKIRAGAIPLAETLKKDPIAFSDQLEEVFRTKAGVDTKDFNSVNTQLMKMFGNQNALGLVAQMINFRAGIGKEFDKNTRAFDIDKTHSEIFDKPNALGQYLDFKATETNARAAAGRPVAELGGTIAEKLTAAIDYMRSKTGDSSAYDMAAVGVLTLGKASAEAADGVSIFGKFLNGVTGGGGGGGGTGGDGIAGTGVTPKEAVVGGGVGLWKMLQRAGGAGMSLATGAAGLPLLATLGGGYALYRSRERTVNEDETINRQSQARFDSARKLREQFGGHLPADVAKQLSAEAGKSLNRRNELLDATAGRPSLTRYSTQPYTDTMNSYSPTIAAPSFKQRAPMLEIPEVMGAWIQSIRKQIAEGQIKPDVGEKVLKTTERAYPEIFKKASEEINQLAGQVSPLSKSLADILNPADKMPASLNRFGSSLDTLSAKIDGLTINPPSFDLGGIGGGAGGHTFGLGQPGQKVVRPSLFPSKASGGLVNRGGFVEVHDQEAILPADVTREWRDGDFAGTPDFSAFAQPASREIRIGSISISVPPGSTAAADPQALARFVASEVARQVAEATEQLHDPRYVDMLTARAIDLSSERV